MPRDKEMMKGVVTSATALRTAWCGAGTDELHQPTMPCGCPQAVSFSRESSGF